MNRPLRRHLVVAPPRFEGLKVQRFLIYAFLLLALSVQAQFSPAEKRSTRSVSGQFIVTAADQVSPLANSPRIATNTNLVRLEPALLAISAERIKDSLRRELEIKPGAPWRGQVYLVLHPAQSLDEEVAIITSPAPKGWSYRVELPDVVSRTRFTRALTSVLLLEYVNQGVRPSDPVAEIPAWLTDGLAQEFLAPGVASVILSAPSKVVDGLIISRTMTNEKGLDSLAPARPLLRNHVVLTFAQLSWPTGAQLSGADDGVYRASAQVFVNGLLGLKNGPARLRTFLETLPRYHNWQSAFHAAFHDDFPRALDVEKWWALQIVDFAAHDSGPQWTPAMSCLKLDEILRVPVEMRAGSNALPTRAEISLQALIRNFDPIRQNAALQTRLRDLELAQFRMAPQLAALTAGYRRALADYLGQPQTTAHTVVLGKHDSARSKKTSRGDTLNQLNVLDAQRRQIEATIKPDVLKP
jgi:hypothetical protein